jgi:cysteinyl-tRNA synthetase
MTLRLNNTLTRRKEEFRPLDPQHVRMYVCGPTVYDFAHIGNARPVVVFDVLYRLLKRLSPRVTYVRNITDVDDKIMAAAKDAGEPIETVTAKFAQAYRDDMAALGALAPDAEPRATEHIPEMIALVERLIARGHAYAAQGHVLFSVPSMADYGRLSRMSRDELVAGARVEIAPYKNDAADFVLWKPSAADQPGWPSPWGRGRPGWHLECSAMSERHLGVPFDIHGGGLDLVFPHHENEIAQSRCAHGLPEFARYWLHNGYLTVDGEKMSKSLGNFFTVRQLLDDGWDGETIRFALLKAHYRQPLDFSVAALNQARTELNRFYASLRVHQDVEPARAETPEEIEIWLCDDLNTPSAIAELHNITSDLNNKRGDPAQSKGKLLAAGRALGLLQDDPEERRRRVAASPATVSGAGSVSPPAVPDAHIEKLIALRADARRARDFVNADLIRKKLADEGIVLEDRPDGTTDWRRE